VLALIVAATLTSVGALILGQAACWVCGVRSWTFLAAPVGLALLLLIAIAAIHVPGHATTVAVLMLVLLLASLTLLVREPALRPRPTDLLAAAPAAFLALLPFLASGRAGTLGVSFDVDMSVHLMYAEAIRSPAVARVTGLSASYPIGPHAVCAVLAQATGMRVDYAFAGETMATPILLAVTTLGALRRAGWLGKAFVATLSSLTFLAAAYYAEGSFKEIMQAMFVLGFALGLEELTRRDVRGPLRWVPLGLIAGGALSVYSTLGLFWLLPVLGLWLLVLVIRRALRCGSVPIAWLRGAVWPSVVALGVLLVLLVPQLPRLARYYHFGGIGIKVTELGNLVGWGALSPWKVFGMWDVADFRMPAADPFHVGMFAGLGLIVTVVGGIWWIRQEELAVPLAGGVAAAIWIYSNHYQSPYVAAKALMILSPLVMLIATRWLVEPDKRRSWLSSVGAMRLGLAGLLGWAVLGSSMDVLRNADVGPTAHVDELRSLEPMLGRSKTMFLGRDLYIRWELAGTPVDQPDPEAVDALYLAFRPQKPWKPGESMDFDSLSASTFDEYRFVITIRNPGGSEPPSNMRLVRTTRSYQLWERVGPTPEHEILAEGQEPGGVLNCANARGQSLAHSRGYAAVRPESVLTPLPTLSPGSSANVSVHLKPGSWWLSEPYISTYPIDVAAPGLHVTLPANLDWPVPGPRWPVGRVTVTAATPLTLTFHVHDTALGAAIPGILAELVATPAVADHIVALRDACGKYVDWYRLRPTPSRRLAGA